jgi:four helix bundle protein
MEQKVSPKNKPQFHTQLKEKLNVYVHSVYAVTRRFPKDEIFGVTSQLRRASLSVVLNYVEGYARMRGKVYKNFLEIAYGSLQESKYLLDFCFIEQYLREDEYKELLIIANEIGRMLWGILLKIKE